MERAHKRVKLSEDEFLLITDEHESVQDTHDPVVIKEAVKDGEESASSSSCSEKGNEEESAWHKMAKELKEKFQHGIAVDESKFRTACESRGSGVLEVVKAFVETGKVDLNYKNYRGDTPLTLAARSGELEVMKYLIEKGANLELRNEDRESALLCCCSSVKKIKLLIEKGAKVKVKSKYGSPLMHACGSLGENLESIEYLIKNGAVINETCASDGMTPLILSIVLGKEDQVKFLLDNGADPDFPCKKGKTPLRHSRDEKMTQISKILTQRGAICKTYPKPARKKKASTKRVAKFDF